MGRTSIFCISYLKRSVGNFSPHSLPTFPMKQYVFDGFYGKNDILQVPKSLGIN